MKEAEKKGAVGIRPSEQVLRYLYICALDGKAPVDEKVNRYFIDKLSGEGKELTIYGKALGAIILQQAGKVAEAKLFMLSLMEYSVVTDEWGVTLILLKPDIHGSVIKFRLKWLLWKLYSV